MHVGEKNKAWPRRGKEGDAGTAWTEDVEEGRQAAMGRRLEEMMRDLRSIVRHERLPVLVGDK